MIYLNAEKLIQYHFTNTNNLILNIMKHNFSTLKDFLRKFDSKFLQHFMVAGLLFFSVASMNAQNLVVNPGFENVTGGEATGWLKGSSSIGYSAGSKYSGAMGVWLGTSSSAISVKQVITGLLPNTTYTATAMYRFDAVGSAATFGVRYYLTASTGDTNISLTPVTSWTTTGTVTFTTGATSTQAEIFARQESGGTIVRFDDFSMVLGQTTGLERSTVKSNVYSNNSNIVVEGLAAQTANIYSVSGAMVKSVLIKSNLETIAVDKGFYIVRVGGQNFKLLIQ